MRALETGTNVLVLFDQHRLDLLSTLHEKFLNEIFAVIGDVPKDFVGEANISLADVLHRIVVILTTERG